MNTFLDQSSMNKEENVSKQTKANTIWIHKQLFHEQHDNYTDEKGRTFGKFVCSCCHKVVLSRRYEAGCNDASKDRLKHLQTCIMGTKLKAYLDGLAANGKLDELKKCQKKSKQPIAPGSIFAHQLIAQTTDRRPTSGYAAKSPIPCSSVRTMPPPLQLPSPYLPMQRQQYDIWMHRVHCNESIVQSIYNLFRTSTFFEDLVKLNPCPKVQSDANNVIGFLNYMRRNDATLSSAAPLNTSVSSFSDIRKDEISKQNDENNSSAKKATSSMVKAVEESMNQIYELDRSKKRQREQEEEREAEEQRKLQREEEEEHERRIRRRIDVLDEDDDEEDEVDERDEARKDKSNKNHGEECEPDDDDDDDEEEDGKLRECTW
jgi:hypothetical protein